MLGFSLCPLALVVFAASVSAKQVVITVGNTTDDATTVFQPPSIVADKGDVVFFNFTQGNHSVTQSTFAAPCDPIHNTNITVNGFDSGFRNAGNHTAITDLVVPITDNSTTIWFFDRSTCAEGGVGGININDTTLETLDGAQRNAVRLNGTGSSTLSSSFTRTRTATATSSSPTSNDATRIMGIGGVAVVPLIMAAVAL